MKDTKQRLLNSIERLHGSILDLRAQVESETGAETHSNALMRAKVVVDKLDAVLGCVELPENEPARPV